MKIDKTSYRGVYKVDGKLATRSIEPGYRSHGEKTVKKDDEEYRLWDPNRSKLAASIKSGIDKMPIRRNDKVLYLGAAQGYTPSFISDLVGENGLVYCIEFSERAVRDLLKVCENRKNMIPELGDARKPKDYPWVGVVDILYVDIAQPDATEVAIRNADMFLKDGGFLMFAIKSRSVDVTKDPKKIFKEEIEKLRNDNFHIEDWERLDPFEKDHAFVVARKI
ncbi:MAG: fibrillarin-like rRNA/tRNA 2'-O-methyltransferase [Candidatus Aenigmatarchaeota archaeon]